MQQVKFDLGRLNFPVSVPSSADVLRMKDPIPLSTPQQTLLHSFENPIDCRPLQKLIKEKLQQKADARAVIVISDNTRPVPYRGEDGILFPLIEKMLRAGLKSDRITLLVATGTHHPMTEPELRDFLDPRIFALGISLINHDCRDSSGLELIGETKFGGAIKINRFYLESDIKILTGLVESHFMAGVSGGRKSICPGLLAETSIYGLHGGSILSSPFAADLVLKDNPVHEEALTVARLAGCDFIINVTLDANYRLTGIFSGHMEAAHQQAFEYLKSYAAIPVEKEYDLVITQAGFVGINHYQAAKGALACLPLIHPESRCIIAAFHPDRNPIGGKNYQAMMKLLGELGAEKYSQEILDPDWKFVPEQWQAQMWAKLFKVIPPQHFLYCSRELKSGDFSWLPGKDARSLVPDANDLPDLVNKTISAAQTELCRSLGREPLTAVLPDGPYAVPVKKSKAG